MQVSGIDIRRLIPRGTASALAKELGMSPQAIGLALKAGRPSHPAVRAAIKLAEESGALAAALKLATLNQAA
jgi:diacylglycerol kinase family enzyme